MPDESWFILDIVTKQVTWIIVDFGVPACCIKIDKIVNPQDNNCCLVKIWILGYLFFGIIWWGKTTDTAYQLVRNCTNKRTREIEAFMSVSEAMPGIKEELLRIFDEIIKND
jgi:carbon starvation protein CstA